MAEHWQEVGFMVEPVSVVEAINLVVAVNLEAARSVVIVIAVGLVGHSS